MGTKEIINIIMNISEAVSYFKKLLNETDQKSELRVYEKFVAMLSDLKNKDLTQEEFVLIEEELDELELQANVANRKKYIRKKYNLFTTFLKDKLSLTTEGYYTGIGIALGVAFGAAFISIFGSGISISLGMVIGLAIGAQKDAQAKKQNRVLKIKLD